MFLIKPNLREFAELTGQERMDELQEEHLALSLVSSHKSETVVISLGAAGIWRPPARNGAGSGSPGAHKKQGRSRRQHRGGYCSRPVQGQVLAGGRPLRRSRRGSRGHNSGTELCRRDDTERLFEQIMQRGSL